MLRLSTECRVKGVHPQCVDVVVTCRISPVEDENLQTDVLSASNDMDATDRPEVLREASVVTAPVLVLYRASLFTSLVPQLQLWRLY
jgi:hypothetical protein